MHSLLKRSGRSAGTAAFSDNVPIHHQIAQLLRQRLLAGEPGDAFPPLTERLLCDEFGVSRSTVRQALGHLKRDGLLRSRRGVGTTLSSQVSGDAHVRSSGDPLHASLGTRVQVVSLDRVMPRAAVAAHLQTPEGEPVGRIVRAHELDGKPLSVVVSYLPLALAKGLTKTILRSRSLHEWIEEKAGAPMRRSVHGVRVARADAWLAPMLGVPLAEPVLYVAARAFFKDGRPVRWTDNFFREDRYEYETEIEWASADEGAEPAEHRKGNGRASKGMAANRTLT